MIRPFLVGLLASVLAAIPLLCQTWFRSSWPEGVWFAPVNMIFIGFAAALVQRYGIERRPGAKEYEGVPDLLLHVHSPSSPDSPMRWAYRGWVSLLLAIFGGVAGPEGSAIEFSHAALVRLRSRSARWFEQRRRTDAACALAGGVAAAFQAPFAAVLLPMELGFGGRSISVAISALAATLGVRQLAVAFPSLKRFELGGALSGIGLLDWKEWIGVCAVGLTAGVVGVLISLFLRYSRRNFALLSGKYHLARLFAGGVLLFILGSLWLPGFAPPSQILEEVLWSRRLPSEAGLLLLSSILSLTVLIGCFGSTGIFWPLFAIGGYLGSVANHWLFSDLPGFAAAAGLLGGASLWGSVLGAPVSGAILIFEMSGSHQLLLPGLVAAILARSCARIFRVTPLLERGLVDRGLRLTEGRSIEILEDLNAGQAMVTDFETLKEQESVSELRSKLVSSPYPFFPVVRSDGNYSGLLTLDMVQDAWHSDETVQSHSSLSKLLEVKDLLYRSGSKTPGIRSDQTLAEVSRHFERFPCLPVLHEHRIIGLLFAHNVRMAYDREVARRSLKR